MLILNVLKEMPRIFVLIHTIQSANAYNTAYVLLQILFPLFKCHPHSILVAAQIFLLFVRNPFFCTQRKFLLLCTHFKVDDDWDLQFYREMRLRPGEKIIDRLENIEDTKGNGGERGRLIVTNIRLLWHCVMSPRINLCKIILIYAFSFFNHFRCSDWLQLHYNNKH